MGWSGWCDGMGDGMEWVMGWSGCWDGVGGVRGWSGWCDGMERVM
jgi:hypothetical protein